MNMTPRLRKLALLTHITFSVGWFGAVVPYLALTLTGLTSHDFQVVRAAYVSMDLIGWFVIVPFSIAALLTGLIQSLGTQWGLFRHWWIVVKFLLTLVSIFVLLRHMQGASHMSHMATDGNLPTADFRAQQIQHLVHPAGGLLVLLAVMALSVLKPWGMTPYGRRKATEPALPSHRGNEGIFTREPALATGKPRWGRVVWIHAIHAIAVVLLFVAIQHISDGGMCHH
jgi:hypothetical protein